MATAQRLNWGTIVTQALTAGIAGGILVDAYLWLTTVVPAHGSILGMWQWIASTVIGKAAFTSTAYAWLGLLVHLGVSIGWAGGYAYLASGQRSLNERWVLSGVVFGLGVYLFMQIILLGDNNFKPPASAIALIRALVADGVFFGLPVAFVVQRMRTA